MNRLIKIIMAVSLLSLAAAIVCSFSNEMPDKEEKNIYGGSRNIECLYYNKTDFMNVPSYMIRDAGRVQGCIVPHHLVAKNLIHEVFQNVSKNKYKTVVLIGPDHESKDKGKIFTTISDWQTPTGILKTDSETTKLLLQQGIATENDDKLTTEHSTSSIIPFVKHYLGDVNVVTLVITKQVTLEDVNKLADALSNFLNTEDTLFVASVDFSHYLDLDEANKMDIMSMEAIENEDINKIMDFTNDNLDSPMSIITMLKLMGRAKARKTVLNRSNSQLILKESIKETTSYVTYLFYEKQNASSSKP